MTAIADLTDDELRQQLQDYGVNVGPIVSTTRLFYEKKLAKLIDSGGQPPSQSETEESEEEEEEEEDEEVQINYSRQQAPPKPFPQHASTPVTMTRDYEPITQARTATPTSAAVRRNVPGRPVEQRQAATKGSAAQKQGGGWSAWLKLIFVLFVAFLVYLVVINMNPSADIPKIVETDQQG